MLIMTDLNQIKINLMENKLKINRKVTKFVIII